MSLASDCPRTKKFPMVLMLEPLHACNLTCTGCGRIREYESTIKQKLSIDECLAAVDECGAPGRLDLRRRADDLPGHRRARGQDPGAEEGRHPVHQRDVHPQEARANSRRAGPSFSTSTWTGCARITTSPSSVKGVFDAAIDGIKAAKEAGFLVCTNTTVFQETDMAELDSLFAYLTTLDVDGFIISPAYSYAAVNSKRSS